MMSCDRKRVYRIGNVDRISELPEPIILDILSRLPLQDAARASILSKTWRSFCSLNPILYFDHNLFAFPLLVSAKEDNGEPDLHQIRDTFMDHVDRRLSKANQLDFPIRKLALTVAIDDSMYFSRVDAWLELVTQLNVEDLCVFVQTVDYNWEEDYNNRGDIHYEFPYSVLASKRLRSLFVRGCRLGSEMYISDGIKERGVSFNSLQRLCLSHVSMGEHIWENLISCCQGIEMLVLEHCTMQMEYLDLSRFPNLNKALIGLHSGFLENVVIVDTNLQCFKCETFETQCHFSPAACAGIKELSLLGCTINLPVLFQDLTATFPLIEEVEFEIHDIETIKAANNLLRKLTFYSPSLNQVNEVHVDCPNLTLLDCHTYGLTELYADCPKLREFSYNGDTIPTRVYFSPTADLEESRCRISLNSAYDVSSFINLKAFLIQILGRRTSISLSVALPMVTFKPEEIEPFQPLPQNNVHLTLHPHHDHMEDVASLLDALLWIIRPTTLTIRCRSFYLLKYMCESLVKIFKGDASSEQFCQPCWLHQLEDFQVESTLDIPDMKENLAFLPEQCRTLYNVINFKLQWSL